MDLFDNLFNFAKPQEVQGVSWDEGEKAVANATDYEPPSLLTNDDINYIFERKQPNAVR